MKRTFLYLATTLAIHFSALAETQVPSLMNYQGHVTNAAGDAIGTGSSVNRSVTFRFWKSATDTAAEMRLYSETQTVTILNGDFSVLIGNGAAVDGETNAVANVAGLFANKEVFLGITVDDGNPATTDAEITPRQQLVTTAFAFRATVAESVDNGAISNAMLDANAVNTDQLVASSVTNDKMAASSVTSANIVDGTITKADIGTDAVEADEIAANAVGTSEIKDGSVTLGKIAENAVDSSKIVNSSVTGTDILNGTITSYDLAANSVGATQIFANSVTVDKLGTGTVRGEETLRIVRGTVNWNGTRYQGSGFTCSKTATGKYTINFSTAFSSAPSVTANQWQGGADDNIIIMDTVTSNFFTISIRDVTDQGLEDAGFMFIVVGPVTP